MNFKDLNFQNFGTILGHIKTIDGWYYTLVSFGAEDAFAVSGKGKEQHNKVCVPMSPAQFYKMANKLEAKKVTQSIHALD